MHKIATKANRNGFTPFYWSAISQPCNDRTSEGIQGSKEIRV